MPGKCRRTPGPEVGTGTSVGPRAFGGRLGTLSTFMTQGKELVQRETRSGNTTMGRAPATWRDILSRSGEAWPLGHGADCGAGALVNEKPQC